MNRAVHEQLEVLLLIGSACLIASRAQVSCNLASMCSFIEACLVNETKLEHLDTKRTEIGRFVCSLEMLKTSCVCFYGLIATEIISEKSTTLPQCD